MAALTSTALLTDRYELTMLDAALQSGSADRRVTFEVFTRRLPPGRRFGVFAGLGRVVESVTAFRFEDSQLEWLQRERVVSDPTLDWLRSYRFSGDMDAYAEGELYTDGSPVLTVEGSFAEAVILETLVLSIVNHDSSVAAAASLIAQAAGDRPVIEMGSRRVEAAAAVAAARAAYIAGLASTSNLEAGYRYGVPTAGTAAHAFVLLFDDERSAFAAQVAALGSATTLLVDTFDTEAGIRAAIGAAGRHLAAIRIDSGDLAAEATRARVLLDSLGASATKVIVTGDLDEASIRLLAGCPVDGYGAGTSVVTGSGYPSAGFVYKLVDVEGRSVAKASPGKATFGGRKWAWRVAERAEEVVATAPDRAPVAGRALQGPAMRGGLAAALPGLDQSRLHHRRVVDEMPGGASLRLVRR